MSALPAPRMARLKYFRSSKTGRVVMVNAIHAGPKSEIGRYVQVVVTKADLPMLRQVIEAVEQADYQ